MTAARSPRISQISWGKVQLEGYGQPFKDVKLYTGGAREWDWAETGTRHRPGIQPADVEELIAHGATVVVLSTGFYKRLGVCEETLRLLQQEKITTQVVDTEQAVTLYNELLESEAAAALIHSTC